MIFYDKWIDGLVFHDTKTTNFKTQRDFVRELAAACQRRDLRFVLYFNAVSDGNPEFDMGVDGSPRKTGRVQSELAHALSDTPFAIPPEGRRASSRTADRVRPDRRHLARHLWRAAGRAESVDRAGYEKMYGEKFENVPRQRMAEFNARTLADYLDEIDVIRRQAGQDSCLFTANGAGSSFLASNVWTRHVGARLQYCSMKDTVSNGTTRWPAWPGCCPSRWK